MTLRVWARNYRISSVFCRNRSFRSLLPVSIFVADASSLYSFAVGCPRQILHVRIRQPGSTSGLLGRGY
jgi:hypothetical protein